MTKIHLYDSYCSIQEEPDIGFLWHLDNHLSYKFIGAEHTASYRGYFRDGQHIKWDGLKHLLTDQLDFPIGLLSRVQEFYQSNNRELQVIDRRALKQQSSPIEILSTLKRLQKTPFDYQLEVANLTKTIDRGIIRLATGGGKSLIACLITSIIGKKTIIYVIGTDLLYQIHKLFSSVFNQKIGLIGDGICEIANINIASIWTIGKTLGLNDDLFLTDLEEEEKVLPSEKHQEIKKLLSSAKLHIFDECHLAACNTIQKISQNINPEHIYGMSASPWRDDGADLLIEAIFGKYIVNISASYLIERGYLVKPIINFIKVPPLSEIKSKAQYKTVYNQYIVNNAIRNNLIVTNAEKLVEEGRSTLVLFNNIAHGELLHNTLKEKVPCLLLSGKDSNDIRLAAKDQLEQGHIKCILASRIFDIGVDLPILSGLVLAGGGKSSVRAFQRIGRVIRRYPNKIDAKVFDFYDNTRFLMDHSEARLRTYSTEKGFDINYGQ